MVLYYFSDVQHAGTTSRLPLCQFVRMLKGKRAVLCTGRGGNKKKGAPIQAFSLHFDVAIFQGNPVRPPLDKGELRHKVIKNGTKGRFGVQYWKFR
jgi:hypothetical protein